MKTSKDRRPKHHAPHPRLRSDGRFRLRHVDGKEASFELHLASFKAYMRGIGEAHRRSAWGRKMRIKRRFASRYVRPKDAAGAMGTTAQA